MENFGNAQFIMTKFMKSQLLVFKCARGNILFEKKSSKRLRDGTTSTYFECKSCASFTQDGLRSPRVTVNEGVICTNPEIGHKPGCVALNDNELESIKITREAKKQAREGIGSRCKLIKMLWLQFLDGW